MHRIILEPVFILHRRPYRNTSLIVDVLTKNHGRIALVARSARGLKSRYKGILQPFVPLIASWSGRTELKALGNVELNGAAYALDGDHLMCGFYVNELLTMLLHRDDPHPLLFDCYQQTLEQLQNGDVICTKEKLARALRYFEKCLLQEIGYGLPLTHDEQGDLIDSENFYRYFPERGFIKREAAEFNIPGHILMALQQDQFDNPQTLKYAKSLMRAAINYHLNGKQLRSRELSLGKA